MQKQVEADARRSVVVNGAASATSASTLGELLIELGLGSSRVATAVNGDFVPASARAGLAIANGDRIEIVSPRQGG